MLNIVLSPPGSSPTLSSKLDSIASNLPPAIQFKSKNIQTEKIFRSELCSIFMISRSDFFRVLTTTSAVYQITSREKKAGLKDGIPTKYW